MKQILTLHEQKDERIKIHSAKSIFESIEKIDVDYDQENFLVFFLNTKNRLLNCEILFKGSVDACIVDPKIIFKKALLNKAVRIIVAHNHPSNELTPSEEDLQIFEKLKQGGDLLGIDVLDNIIFNPKEYYSTLEEGDI